VSPSRPWSTESVAALALDGDDLHTALIGRDGTVHFTQSTPELPQAPGLLLQVVAESADDLLRARPGIVVRGAGVAMPASSGILRTGPAGGWRDSPLARQLATRLDLPLVVGPTVRCAAVAEARLGAGLAEESVLYVALGAEVGAGYVRGGRVDSGVNGLAGQFGHLRVRPDGPMCDCGAAGCLQVYVQLARAEQRETGDRAAAAEWHEFVAVLADGLAAAITMLDPAVVVVGGDLVDPETGLLRPLRAELADRLSFRDPPPVRVGRLGAAAAAVGAALTAWDVLDGRR
jgi:glucokinase